MLPGDFPKWRTVHAYFQIWSEKKDGQESILEQALKKLAEKYRSIHGRNEKASFCIIDAQSVKNTDSAEEKGYDAGKKVSGIKRHIGVDILGLPLAIHITTADRNDRTGATEMLELYNHNMEKVTAVLVDGAYHGKPFAQRVKRIIGADVAPRNKLHTFKVMPKRWIVERSFGWLEKHRRLWKNCDRKINSSLHMVVLAFLAVLLKRF